MNIVTDRVNSGFSEVLTLQVLIKYTHKGLIENGGQSILFIDGQAVLNTL